MGAYVPTAIQQHGLDQPEALGIFLNNKLPTQTPSTATAWTVENAYPNLTFVDPLQLIELPGTNRFLMAGKRGKIWTFDKDPTTNTKQVVVDIEAQVLTSGDAGLMGVAVHPEFHVSGSPNEGYFYVWYRYKYDPSYNGNLAYLRLSRFRMTPGTFTAPNASEYVLIQQYDRHQWHNGGGLFFDEDGLLYITVGDEGGANDQYNTGQKIDVGLLAGVLRIDVDQDLTRSHATRRQPLNPASPPSGWPNSYSQGYTIPDDNPWQDVNGDILEEFYAIGLRSPHRMTYDTLTGDIWVGDIGQSSREEISRIVKGGNYQWPYREGAINGPKTMPNPLIGTDEAPFYDYPRSQGTCIIGGFVYRGAKWASTLGGLYLLADHTNRNVWTLNPDDINPQETFLLNVPNGNNGTGGKSGISSFATDSAGEVYILKLFATNQDGGIIYKLKAASTVPEPPALLSQTGAFKNVLTLEPEDGLIPYGLNVPFWSDGAAKFRWMGIPNNGTHNTNAEQIDYSATGEWQFPEGTVFIKHFEYPTDDSDPSITRRLETRFVVHGTDGKYYGATYRWREDQSDAELLTGGWNDTISISSANGTREIVWQYPDRQQCITCHNEAAGGVLGPKTRQLNGDLYYDETGRTANQLTTLEHLGIFSTSVDTNNLGSLLTSAPSNDNTYSLNDRARAYIDANCASCHRPGNSIQANFDARLSTPLSDAEIIYGDLNSSLGLTGMREVVPQDPEHSMMYMRIKAVHEDFAMPPLAKNKIDENGVQLIYDWINSLDPASTQQTTTVVANYINDFGSPAANPNWTYLWNDGGAIGNSANYTPMLWNGVLYDSDGVNNGFPDNTNLAWGNFTGVGGHTGRSLGQGQAVNRFVIAAYTVTVAGDYSISNSNYTDANSGCGDGAEVLVYVNNTLISTNSFPNGGSTTFDGSLGSLQVGDVIYVAAGPGDVNDSCDGFSWDFSIEKTGTTGSGQRIDFAELPNRATTDPSFILSATASSGLPVNYQIVSGPATLSGDELILSGQPGRIIVRATQTGNGSTDAAPVVDRAFWVSPSGSGVGTGLLGTYHNDETLTDPQFARIDPELDFYWGSDSPDPSIQHNTFSVVWEGEIEVPYSETFTFTTRSDDGIKLWVDGQLIIDEWNDQAATQFTGTAALTAWQRVPIRIEYYQQNVYASARLQWASASTPLQVVPSLFLYPAPGTSFPIELLSFDARPEGNQVLLNWETAWEQNSDYFVIERTPDGVEFQDLLQVGAAGNSTEPLTYLATDQTPLRGRSYYRIRAVDFDGTTDYSELKEVFIDRDVISIFPNPLGSHRKLVIDLDFESAETIYVLMTDVRGNIVVRDEVRMSSGRHRETVSLESLAAGVYFVTISNERHQLVKKLVLR